MNKPVSFELGKFLREKGFNEPCKKVYSTLGQLWDSHYSTMSNNDVDPGTECTAPTIAEVVMWLYETHNIWIVAFPTEQDWTFDIFKGSDCIKSESFFNSPIEAYEVAINHYLTKLI